MAALSTSAIRTTTASMTTSRTASTIQSSRTTTTVHTPSAPGPMRNIRAVKTARRGYGLFYSDDEDEDAPNETNVLQTRQIPATTSKLPRHETEKQPDFAFKSNRKALFVPATNGKRNERERDEELGPVNGLRIPGDNHVRHERSHRHLNDARDRGSKVSSQSSSKRGQSSRKQPYIRGGQKGNTERRTGFGLIYDHDDDSIELEEKFNAQYASATDESAPQTPRADSGTYIREKERMPLTPVNKDVSQIDLNQYASSSPEYQYPSRSPDGHPTPGGKTSWGQWIKKLIPGSVKKSALSRSAELLEDVDRNVNLSEKLARSDQNLAGSTQASRYDQEDEQSFLVPGAFDGLFEDDMQKSGKKGSQHNYANSLLLSEVYNSRLITPDARSASLSKDSNVSRARYTARPSRRVSTSFTGHDRPLPSHSRLPMTRVATPMKLTAPKGASNTTASKRVRRDYVVEAMTEAEKERIQIQKLAELEQTRRDLAVKLNESAYEERKLRASLGLELPDDDEAQSEGNDKVDQEQGIEDDMAGENNKKRKADQQAQENDNVTTESSVTESNTVDDTNGKTMQSNSLTSSSTDSIPKLPATPTLSHAQLPTPVLPETAPVPIEATSNTSTSNRGAISPQKSLGYARSQAEKFKPIKSSGLRSSTTISSTFPTEDSSEAKSTSSAFPPSDGLSNGVVNGYSKLSNNANENGNTCSNSMRKHIDSMQKNLELYIISPVKAGKCSDRTREAVEEVWDPTSESVLGLVDHLKSAVRDEH